MNVERKIQQATETYKLRKPRNNLTIITLIQDRFSFEQN